MATEFRKVNKDVLKEAVNKQLGQVTSEKDVTIVGARLIKDGRLELEFAQSRKLRQAKTSELAILNAGDERFNPNNRQIVRIWHMFTLEGAEKAFNVDFQPVADAAEGL